MAGSVNNLLQVGFYLINIGYALSVLTIYETLFNLQRMLESLSVKVGTIILILGVMHFFNLFVLFKLRSKNKIQETPLFFIYLDFFNFHARMVIIRE